MIHAAQAHPFDFIVDGEAIGERLHVFDLLECRGRDLRGLAYWERLTELARLFEPGGALQPVATAVTSEDKRTLLAEVRKRNAEGIVIKDRRAPFQPGRPASAGSQLKFKFVTTASFIVAAINSKRSVALELMNGEQTCPAGNVTIPAGEEIPTPGEIVEVRYLYAFREGGRIYQPAYLGKRDDLVASDCSTDQLKFAPSKAA